MEWFLYDKDQSVALKDHTSDIPKKCSHFYDGLNPNDISNL